MLRKQLLFSAALLFSSCSLFVVKTTLNTPQKNRLGPHPGTRDGHTSKTKRPGKRIRPYRLTSTHWKNGTWTEALGGKLIKRGRTKGHLTVSFTSKKNWCFSLFLTSSNQTKPALREKFSWTHRIRSAVSYQIRNPGDLIRTHGICTPTGRKSVRIQAKLTLAGTRPFIQYVVIGWPRSALPDHQTAFLQVDLPDHCNTREWVGLWTHHAPGTLVYYRNRPYLLLREDDYQRSRGWITLVDVTGRRVRATKRGLHAALKGVARFSPLKPTPPRCRCDKRVRNRYSFVLSQLKRAVRRAYTASEKRAARRRLTQAYASLGRKLRKTCGYVRRDLKRNWAKAVDTIIDRFAGKRAPKSIRAKLIAQKD